MKSILIVLSLLVSVFLNATNPAYCQGTTNDYNASETNANANIDSQDLLPSSAPITAAEAPSLGDIANKISMSIEASDIAIDGLRGLSVKITNQSDSPVLVNADAAEITSPKTKLAGVPLTSFEIATGPPQGFKAVLRQDVKDTITAAVTVGAVQTIQGFQTQRKPILKRYGADEERRQNEIIRFGKRLLWPGDMTQGVIYFNTTNSFVGSLLEVPISLPFGKDKNLVEKISAQISK
jgi:hypothetical protein